MKKWEPSKKRKKFRDGRGWIGVYYQEPHYKGWTGNVFKSWSMSINRANGAAYLTVFSFTRRELPGLMRIELAKKKNPTFAAVNERMGGKQGTLFKKPMSNRGLSGFTPPLVVIDDLSDADISTMFDAIIKKSATRKKKK